jgi:hypothetical protein
MTGQPWAEREPDEPVLDWMLRLQISQAAMDAGLVPADRNVPSWWVMARQITLVSGS